MLWDSCYTSDLVKAVAVNLYVESTGSFMKHVCQSYCSSSSQASQVGHAALLQECWNSDLSWEVFSVAVLRCIGKMRLRLCVELHHTCAIMSFCFPRTYVALSLQLEEDPRVSGRDKSGLLCFSPTWDSLLPGPPEIRVRYLMSYHWCQPDCQELFFKDEKCPRVHHLLYTYCSLCLVPKMPQHCLLFP